MSEAGSARRRARRGASALSVVGHAVEWLESRQLLASVANKIADINQTTSYLNPSNFTPVGTHTFFAAQAAHGDGAELWITDGTTAGTVRLKDINPGAAGSNPSNLFAVGSTLYFSADDGVHGAELWKSDGTAAGTVMVKDLNPGAAASSPGTVSTSSSATGGVPAMVNNAGTLYFVAADASGTSLFKSDGTEAGTSRVTTANYAFAPRGTLAVANGDVYFGGVAQASSSGNAALFRTNTLVGAPPVITLKTFSTTTKPSNLTTMGGKVYFSADQDSSNKGDLFVSDGTTAGTTFVAAIGTASYSSPTNFRASGSLLYFVNYEIQTGKTELWRTDGSAAGTIALSTTLSIDRSFNPFIAWGLGYVSFVASGSVYTSQGAAATTHVLTGLPVGTTANGLIGAGGRFYVLATKSDGYNALYSTDGGSVSFVADLGTDFFWGEGLLNVATSNTPDLLFTRTFGAGLGDLWRSGGTAATTVRVGATNNGITASSMRDYNTVNAEARAFTPLGTGLLFAADDGVHGQEVWITYPSTGETKMLADVNAGAGASNPNGFAVDPSNAIPYFQAYTPATGTELFRILPGGTVQIASNLAAGSASSNPIDLRFANGYLYFRATVNSTSGLYRYDPSTLTTSPILGDAYALTGPSPVLVNGSTAIVSAANTSTSTQTLYKLNGTAAPTVLASGVSIQGIGWGDKMFVNVGSVTYFVGYDSTHGAELWRSDGTATGTYRISEIGAGSVDGGVLELTSFGGQLYFSASSDGGLTQTLWTSDGTLAGTVPYAPAAGFTAVTSIAALPNSMQMIATSPGKVAGVWNLPFGTGNSTPTLNFATTATIKPQMLYVTGSTTAFVVTLDDTGVNRQFNLYRTSSGTNATPVFIKALWTYNPFDPTMASTWGVGHLAFATMSNRLYFPAFRPEYGVEPTSYLLDPIATTVSGNAYWDTNANGTRDGNESDAPNVDVYVDLDNDGTPDADEPTATTDANGLWQFNGLDIATTYTVRLLPFASGSGVAQSEPASNAALTRTLPATGTQTGTGAFGLVDTIAPSVTSIVVDRDAAAFTLRVGFSEPIDAASLAAEDLVLLTRPGGSVAVPSGAIHVSYDAATRVASFTFPGMPDGLPPTGWLSATIASGGVADGFGNLLGATTPSVLSVLPGDADGDGDVDFTDLLTLAKNYGTSGKHFSQGNFDYDAAGTVDFSDLLILAKHYNVTVGPAPAAPPLAAATVSTPRKRPAVQVLGSGDAAA